MKMAAYGRRGSGEVECEVPLTINCNHFGLHHTYMLQTWSLLPGKKEVVATERENGAMVSERPVDETQWVRIVKQWEKNMLVGKEYEKEGRDERTWYGSEHFITAIFVCEKTRQQMAMWNIQIEIRNGNTGSLWRNTAAKLKQHHT